MAWERMKPPVKMSWMTWRVAIWTRDAMHFRSL